jgi:hypothetical protein
MEGVVNAKKPKEILRPSDPEKCFAVPEEAGKHSSHSFSAAPFTVVMRRFNPDKRAAERVLRIYAIEYIGVFILYSVYY